MVAASLHAITESGKGFQWGKGQQKTFEELKKNISQAPVLELPNLQWPLEVEIDVSGYSMGDVLIHGGRPICYHYEVFHGAFLNYPT